MTESLGHTDPSDLLVLGVYVPLEQMRACSLRFARPTPPPPRVWPIAGVDHVVLVSSAKGGVGKSTTAGARLAIALKLAAPNKSIGLLDADVYGPSIPRMMNLKGQPALTEKNFMKPLVNYDVKWFPVWLRSHPSACPWGFSWKMMLRLRGEGSW